MLAPLRGSRGACSDCWTCDLQPAQSRQLLSIWILAVLGTEHSKQIITVGLCGCLRLYPGMHGGSEHLMPLAAGSRAWDYRAVKVGTIQEAPDDVQTV